MRRLSWPIGIFAITCGVLANGAPARAQSDETWVSVDGTDAGTCPITAPCRTFQFVHNKTKQRGTVTVLTSGSFGPLTITKSISIVADGVVALIDTGANGAAITVNGFGIIVSLRGLTIELSDNIGISFINGTGLHVHNCVIRESTLGIKFAPSNAGAISDLYVVDSVIANTTSQGINVRPTGSSGAKVVIERVRVENTQGSSPNGPGISFHGVATTGSIKATVRNSVTAGHFGSLADGIQVFESGSGTTDVMVDRTASVNNESGVVASGPGATIRIGDSTVSGNNTGLFATDSGVIISYGTNKVDGNGTDGAPTTTIAYK